MSITVTPCTRLTQACCTCNSSDRSTPINGVAGLPPRGGRLPRLGLEPRKRKQGSAHATPGRQRHRYGSAVPVAPVSFVHGQEPAATSSSSLAAEAATADTPHTASPRSIPLCAAATRTLPRRRWPTSPKHLGLPPPTRLASDLLKLEAIQKELAHYNGGEPTFSQWAEAAGTDENTLRKRLNYGIYCKNTMVRSNVRLVISIAREFEGPGMEFSDLIQEGMQGLVRGAEKFDGSKGFRFSTYSHWWIKQAIRKSVLEQTQIIRLPAHMADASSRVKECRRRLRQELKRLPTNEEIASDTGMPIRRVEAAMSLPKYRVSLTGKVGCTDITYQEITPDTSAETAEEVLHRWFMKKDVDRALDSLSPREKQVIRYRFGMDDGRLRTLHDIGQLMGVSRERIRQIEMGAFRKLRSKKRAESLQHCLEPAESW